MFYKYKFCYLKEGTTIHIILCDSNNIIRFIYPVGYYMIYIILYNSHIPQILEMDTHDL